MRICAFTGCGCNATHSDFQRFWGIFLFSFLANFFYLGGSQRVVYEIISATHVRSSASGPDLSGSTVRGAFFRGRPSEGAVSPSQWAADVGRGSPSGRWHCPPGRNTARPCEKGCQTAARSPVASKTLATRGAARDPPEKLSDADQKTPSTERLLVPHRNGSFPCGVGPPFVCGMVQSIWQALLGAAAAGK